MKQKIVNLLNQALKSKNINLQKHQIEKLIEIPPFSEMGDYAFPCFILSKKLKQSPNEIAKEISKKIKIQRVVKGKEKIK